MSQLDVNIIAPLGYAGPNLTGDNNFVQVVDVNGDTVLKIPGITSNNIAIGLNTIPSATGQGNTVVGDSSMTLATTGQDNTAFGAGSLGGLTTGIENVAIGSQSGQNIVSSSENTLVGFQAGFGDFALGLGSNNTFVGNRTGYNSSGNGNVFIGWTTALNATTGNNNIVIGSGADKATPTSSNSITLGNSSISVLRCQVTSITSLSDARDKTNVEESDYGIDFVNSLKPVKFEWNTRDEAKKGVKDLGFIAQDLKELDDEHLNLVYDENPDKLEATYGRLIPVLVKAIQDLSKEIENVPYLYDIIQEYKEITQNTIEYPDDFIDPILCIKITDPIMIPEVKSIFDRSSIITHLYTSKTNPFTRKTLTEEEVNNYNELDEIKKQINEFKQKMNEFETNYKK